MEIQTAFEVLILLIEIFFMHGYGALALLLHFPKSLSLGK